MEIYDWLLRRVSIKTGVAVGYLNYLITQGLVLLLATLFRKPPLRGRSPTLRLWTCLLLGLGFGYYNLGKSSIHLVVLPTLLFCTLKNTSLCYAGHSSLCISLLYLWFVDLNCLSYCLERKCLIGYLMSICQKASSLGYCLQDRALGREVNPRLSGRTKVPRDWFDVIPSAPKYFSYLLEFISLPYGPPVFYAQYMNFVEETDFKDLVKDGRSFPSPICAVFCKLSTALLLLTINVYFVKYYSIFYLAQMHSPASEINDWSPLYLMWYAYLACTVNRMAHYISFLITESVCNNSGMGFRFNSAGMFGWDGLTNSDVIGHELGPSWRVAVASWNTRTHAWLHGVAYARGSRRWRTVRAYTLSTLWHGASPGYACTFYTGILFNLASKKVHMVLRPKFLGSRSKKLFYDLLSIVLTRVALTYSALPFAMIHLAPTLAFYGKFYYSLHFIAIGISLIPENLKINWSYQSMLPWKYSKVKDL